MPCEEAQFLSCHNPGCRVKHSALQKLSSAWHRCSTFLSSWTYTSSIDCVGRHCTAYEGAIRSVGIDLQLLGLGRTGHIGFNESGSSQSSRTRLITLDEVTRIDAASDFFGESHVPRKAITMGIDTIMQVRTE